MNQMLILLILIVMVGIVPPIHACEVAQVIDCHTITQVKEGNNPPGILLLPPDSYFAMKQEDKNIEKAEFVRFNGIYPNEWPEAFQLPDGYYLVGSQLKLRDAANQDSQAAGVRSIRINGLAPLSIEETIGWFKKQASSTGYDLNNEERVTGSPNQIVDYGPGIHHLVFTNWEFPCPSLGVHVLLMEDLHGFTFVKGSFSVDLNYQSDPPFNLKTRIEDIDKKQQQSAE